MSAPVRETGSWFARTGAEPDPELPQMFAFPHAGGGAAFFRPWVAALAGHATVLPVVLPGREGRLREPAHTSLDTLLPPLVAALRARIQERYLLFGHSLGALVAHEAARALASTEVGPPACLIVSGRRPPHLPARRGDLHRLDDDTFVAEVARLGGMPPALLADPTLLRVFVPAMRADFTVNETYRLPRPPTLDCPILALTGLDDPEVTPAEMQAWAEVTTGRCRLRVFEGDHFYLQNARADVRDAVLCRLRELAADR
ncbi:alpha/beta fold hydrolase [Micromonospora haikouensis]|uniref:thioesterase II family protein n=1 Tax=Micromonospora haikouensis TaxID=686309 RepID=UPI0037B734E6